MTKPRGKTGSKPLWRRAWVWFVIVQMWETGTSSHRSPWSLMEGVKMILALSVRGKADTPWTVNSCKNQLNGLPRRAQKCSTQAHFQLQNWLPQTCWKQSSVSNQIPACLWQIRPHRPCSEQSAAESRTNTSLRGPVFYLIEFKLSVQKPWCFFTSSMSAGIPGLPSHPHHRTSSPEKAATAKAYQSFRKQCPGWVVERLAENIRDIYVDIQI